MFASPAPRVVTYDDTSSTQSLQETLIIQIERPVRITIYVRSPYVARQTAKPEPILDLRARLKAEHRRACQQHFAPRTKQEPRRVSLESNRRLGPWPGFRRRVPPKGRGRAGRTV